MPLVGVIMGSSSDRGAMEPTSEVLEQLGISHEVEVMSAHRTPDKVREYGMSARDRGVEVIIAGAGGSAGLPGVLASWTTLPIIGVPIPSSDLEGIDALYAIAQMPPGNSSGVRRGGRVGSAERGPSSRRRYLAESTKRYGRLTTTIGKG